MLGSKKKILPNGLNVLIMSRFVKKMIAPGVKLRVPVFYYIGSFFSNQTPL